MCSPVSSAIFMVVAEITFNSFIFIGFKGKAGIVAAHLSISLEILF